MLVPRWSKGQSGNPKGRPKRGTAIAELARDQVEKHNDQVEKHKLIAKLGRIAVRQEEDAQVDLDPQAASDAIVAGVWLRPAAGRNPVRRGDPDPGGLC